MGIKSKFQISNIKYQNHKKSFSLIEMLIVISVLALTLPALFAIVFAILQQQIKIYRISQVKREGDFIINVMENVIRSNGAGIYRDAALTNQVCSNPATYFPSQNGTDDGSNFYLKQVVRGPIDAGRRFRFYLNGSSAIASESSALAANSILTSSKVRITNFGLRCFRPATYSAPVVFIRFTVSYNTTSNRAEDKAALTYATNVKLRNY